MLLFILIFPVVSNLLPIFEVYWSKTGNYLFCNMLQFSLHVDRSWKCLDVKGDRICEILMEFSSYLTA